MKKKSFDKSFSGKKLPGGKKFAGTKDKPEKKFGVAKKKFGVDKKKSTPRKTDGPRKKVFGNPNFPDGKFIGSRKQAPRVIAPEDLKYFVVYKPFEMLSQFTPEHGKKSLKDLRNFPKDVYPVGRLDADSEGLLILTNDRILNNALLNPHEAHKRTYLVQVEGEFTPEAAEKLSKGVTITTSEGKHQTKPAIIKVVKEPGNLPERNPPVRFRKSIPTSFITVTLTEGKNRQVRKMTAAVGFPTLRLIRLAIEDLKLDKMKPGEAVEMEKNALYNLLKIS